MTPCGVGVVVVVVVALWFGAITIADFCGEVDTTLFLQHLELEKTQRFTIAQLLSLRTHVLRRYIKKKQIK